MKGNPAVPGGPSMSRPTWLNAFGAFGHVGFFCSRPCARRFLPHQRTIVCNFSAFLRLERKERKGSGLLSAAIELMPGAVKRLDDTSIVHFKRLLVLIHGSGW